MYSARRMGSYSTRAWTPWTRSEGLHSSAGIRQENEPKSLEKPFYLNITSAARNMI